MTGAELRAMRLAAGLTQLALANRLAVDPQTVSRWERGERRIRPPMAELIRRVIGEGLCDDVNRESEKMFPQALEAAVDKEEDR